MRVRGRVVPGIGKAARVQDSAWGEKVLGDFKTWAGWPTIERGTLNVQLDIGQALPSLFPVRAPVLATLVINRQRRAPVIIVRYRGRVLELMAQVHLRTQYRLGDGAKVAVTIDDKWRILGERQ